MPGCIADESRDAGRNTARLLRTISVCTFIPALAFNIAHGVVYQCALPALGLIPHAFSVALAVHELGWWEWFRKPEYRIILQDDPEETKPSPLRILIITLLDTVFGLSLTGCIVGAYIIIVSRSGWYYGGNVGLSILGTYATLPYIMNALIHGFFLLKSAWEASKQCVTVKQLATCPHCHGSLSSGSVASQPVAETVTESA